jgi:hypothetical protein
MGPKIRKFLSYCRVSTVKQGRSRLGLEAQRAAIADFLNGGQWKLVAEYAEVETGKNDDRPELRIRPARGPGDARRRSCAARNRRAVVSKFVRECSDRRLAIQDAAS